MNARSHHDAAWIRPLKGPNYIKQWFTSAACVFIGSHLTLTRPPCLVYWTVESETGASYQQVWVTALDSLWPLSLIVTQHLHHGDSAQMRSLQRCCASCSSARRHQGAGKSQPRRLHWKHVSSENVFFLLTTSDVLYPRKTVSLVPQKVQIFKDRAFPGVISPADAEFIDIKELKQIRLPLWCWLFRRTKGWRLTTFRAPLRFGKT